MLVNAAHYEPNIELKLAGNVILVTGDVKDLGIPIDNKLTFTMHINHLINRRWPEPILSLNALSQRTHLHLCMHLTFMLDRCWNTGCVCGLLTAF
jgi:hypothetical protein